MTTSPITLSGREAGEPASRPIIMRAPEVRALIREAERPGTGKRQHRVVLKPEMQAANDRSGEGLLRRFPHQKGSGWEVGETLWVREAAGRRTASFLGIEATNGVEEAFYLADGEDVVERAGFNLCPWWSGKTLPAARMPRIASRLTLTVTEVRVQRLQDVCEEDAQAEGCEYDLWDHAPVVRDYRKRDGWFQTWDEDIQPEYVDFEKMFRASFRTLWDGLHGKGAWQANPWVAALTFIPRLANIDAPTPNTRADAPMEGE